MIMKDQILHERVEYRNFRELIEDLGTRYEGRTAYSFRRAPHDKEVNKVSYEGLRDDVRALATEFISTGMSGKHVALVGRLSYEWIVVYYASLASGAVLVPLDRDWTEADLTDTMKKAEVAAVYCDKDVAESMARAATEIGVYAPTVLFYSEKSGTLAEKITSGAQKFETDPDVYFSCRLYPDKMSMLVFTSGTTGKGKGVMLSQHNIISCLTDAIPFIDYGDSALGVLPPHHTYGSTVGILSLNMIGNDIYISSGIRYILKEMKEQKPENLFIVPLYLETFYRKIRTTLKDGGKEAIFGKAQKVSAGLRRIGVDARRKIFSSVLEAFGGRLKLIISGGAPNNQDILDLFDSIGVSVLNGYGITECAPLVAVNRSKNIIRGSVGQPITTDKIKIADPNKDGEGEICVSGPNVMLGYFKDDEATAEAFDADGYFRTGDYGKLGSAGELYITGRKKNLIILSNGKNVYPEEIESEFVTVPGLVDIIVYEGKSRRGMMYNTIVAEIYPDYKYIEENKITDIKKYFSAYVNEYNRTAVPYKKIGLLKIRTTEFPKNTLRKILRFKLDQEID